MISLICVRGNYTYGLCETRITTDEYGYTTTYGIMIAGENKSASIHDISNSFGFVYRLFELIVEEELYPEHLRDVVEDYLSGSFPKIIPFSMAYNDPVIA